MEDMTKINESDCAHMVKGNYVIEDYRAQKAGRGFSQNSWTTNESGARI
jgi:hypothetical protein